MLIPNKQKISISGNGGGVMMVVLLIMDTKKREQNIGTVDVTKIKNK